ncbi:MAG: aminopeptidase P family protein [Gammaproteobacteria bacterium]|nr:aminopeptidase P family protein [Gammaproteobacteria bacterium]
MTTGIGGKTPEQALAGLRDMSAGLVPITLPEYRARIAKAQALMRDQGIDALYVHAGTNLRYFTGTIWYPSERMVGALIPATGELLYIAPGFEEGTLLGYQVVPGAVRVWQEHESPYALFVRLLDEAGIAPDAAHPPRIALDEASPFFVTEGIRAEAAGYALVNGSAVTAPCRMRKSPGELALMQRAFDMSLEVHKAAATILRPGITTAEVEAFIDAAHRKVGAPAGSYFCIVLFGPDSAFPHGVKSPKALELGDMVLIDTGCKLEGYTSDITRSYVFGAATARQREIWGLEKAAQAAAFEAARLGTPCGEVDVAARAVLEAGGLGPDYALPGLPHRTGHGIGLDIHEWPYLVRSDRTPLDVGMCFSDEPMICLPGEFGVRLEDHFYMTEAGPRWFTAPSHAIDDPFGLGV